jgi:hypothetical protein
MTQVVFTATGISGDSVDNPNGTPALVKAGLCWQVLKNKPCKFGDQCKKNHLSLDEFLGKISVQDADSLDVDPPRKLTLDVEKKLIAGLYKTRLCSPYQTGSCKRGSTCNFIHMTGPDAKAIVGKHSGHTKDICHTYTFSDWTKRHTARAMATKLCPWEVHLGDCPQRICFFTHETRESTPVDPLGKPYKKNGDASVYKVPSKAYQHFKSDGINVETLGNWRRTASRNSLRKPSENGDASSDVIKFECNDGWKHESKNMRRSALYILSREMLAQEIEEMCTW